MPTSLTCTQGCSPLIAYSIRYINVQASRPSCLIACTHAQRIFFSSRNPVKCKSYSSQQQRRRKEGVVKGQRYGGLGGEGKGTALCNRCSYIQVKGAQHELSTCGSSTSLGRISPSSERSWAGGLRSLLAGREQQTW